MKCAFCQTELPEKGLTKYMLAQGNLDPQPSCIACVRRLKLKIVGLSDGDRKHVDKQECKRIDKDGGLHSEDCDPAQQL